jgi:hypothetical protein
MSRTINELNTTDTLVGEDKLVLWQEQSGATRAITAADAADYFSLSGGPYQPLDELLTAIAAQGPNTANGDFIQLTGQDTVRVRKLTVATYAALTVIPSSFRFDDMLVYVSSRATDGDGGEGWWRFDASSSATANGGTILAPDAGTGRWIRQYSGALNVRWFGAVGNGVADDTAAIQAGADHAASIGAILIGPAGTYKVTSTITLICDGDLSSMTISANGALVSPVVRFGTTTGGPTENRIMSLPRVVNNARPSGTWGSGVGIELANCNQCMFTVPSVTEFEVGLTCGGYTNGFAHNTVTLGYVYSNKIQLRLRPAGSGGWCNQNTFINGRLGFNSSDFTTSGYVGTRMILMDKGSASSGGPNTNTFVGTSVESDLVEYMVEFKESTANNVLLNGRYEGATPKVLFATDTAAGNSDNLFIGGYGVFNIVFTFSGTGSSTLNNIIGARSNNLRGSGVVFNISNDSTSGIAGPHLQGFEAGTEVLNKSSSATDWAYRLFSQGLSGKRATDAHPRIELDYVNGRVYLGTGLAALTEYVGLLGSALTTTRSFVPATDNNRANGDASFRWSDTFSTNFRPGAGAQIWTTGAGTPQGAVTAPVGSLFTRTDGGVGTTLYAKESGAGNTGWANVQTLLLEDTAANIAAVGNAINTANKYAGKLVWDTTNTRMMRASGSAAADPWVVIDGSASVTPV